MASFWVSYKPVNKTTLAKQLTNLTYKQKGYNIPRIKAPVQPLTIKMLNLNKYNFIIDD